jgi:hypothetical protein
MAKIVVEIENGKARVTADGTPLSCAGATAVEAAIGQTTSKVLTGHTLPAQSVRQQ